jgi:hypothetical protein
VIQNVNLESFGRSVALRRRHAFAGLGCIGHRKALRWGSEAAQEGLARSAKNSPSCAVSSPIGVRCRADLGRAPEQLELGRSAPDRTQEPSVAAHCGLPVEGAYTRDGGNNSSPGS